MSELTHYPSYKDSGVPWLGEIPGHWYVNQLKFSTTCNDEVLSANTDEGYEILYIDISNVSLTKGVLNKENLTFEQAPSRARRVVRDGDILVSTVRTYLKSIAYIEKAEENLIASTGFAVLRPTSSLSSKFLGYWIQSQGVVATIMANSVGVSYPAINSTDLVRLPVVNLPISEQEIIVSFLDKQLVKIDMLISKQEALLIKMNEQRNAIITNAVTKGLNTECATKSSNVEWIGEIPEHWEVWKMSYAVESMGSGTTPKSDDPAYYGGDTLWVTTSELREDLIHDTKKKVSEKALCKYSALRVYPKDSVAIAMYGATIGRLGILAKEATFNQACCVFSESNRINHEFLFFWLWYRRPILISLSNGGGQPNLNQDELSKIRIPLPPIEEQELIISFIKNEVTKIDNISSTTQKITDSLREYRSTLITQAVTGKIDVRDFNSDQQGAE